MYKNVLYITLFQTVYFVIIIIFLSEQDIQEAKFFIILNEFVLFYRYDTDTRMT